MTALPRDAASDLERENARLRDELRTAREQQAGSAEILSAIASAPGDAERSLQQIIEITARLFGASSVTLNIAGADEWVRMIRVGTSSQRVGSEVSAAQLRMGARNLPGTVFRENRQIHIPDMDNVDPAIADWPTLPHARAAGARAMAGTPLRREGKAIGALVVHRNRPAPFTPDELALLQSFADQAAIAIENARLFNETKEALERQTATADILKVIASSPADVQPVFEAIAESAKRLIGGFSTTVLRFIGDELHLVAYTPTDPAADEALKSSFPRLLAEFPTFALVRDGQTVQFADTESESVPVANRELGRLRGFRSVLFTPLMNQGTPIGMISVTRAEPGRFADHHVQLLQTFADQAVIAIENVRLFEQVQAKTRDLSESLQQQTATADVLKVISRSAFDLQTVLDTLVQSAARLCDADECAIFQPRDGAYRLAANWGLTLAKKEFLQNHLFTPGRETAVGRVLLEGKTAHIHDTETDPNYVERPGDPYPVRTRLGVPLLREGAPIGVFVLTRREFQPFSEKQIELVQTFADQAVIAIENARLFDEVQAKTRDLTESLQQQTATADVLKVISRSTFDLQAVLHTLVESAARLCDADQGTITRQKDGKFYRAESFGHSREFMDYVGDIPVVLDRGSASGRALLEGVLVHIADVQADPEYTFNEAQRLGGYRTCLGVPILREGVPVGVLSLTRSEVRPFTDKQIELVTTFADQAAIAIENARLFEEVQAKTRELSEALTYQTGSSNILSVIASSPTDVAPVLKAIVESASELCDAYDAIVLLKDGDELCFNAHHGPIPLDIEKWPINRNWTPGRALIDRKPVHVHDMHSVEGNEFPEGREMSLRQGQRTVLSVPLLRENEGIGAIVLRRTEVHPFSDKQIALLQTFADQAVIAIGNVRLFEEVQERTEDLRESLEFQTATSDVLKVISSSPDSLQPVLDVIVDTARHLCGTETSTIFLLKDDKFHIAAASGARPEYMEFLQNNPIALDQAGSSTSRAAREKRTVHIPDIGADPEFGRGPMAVGQRRALLSVPLMREGAAIGVITMRQSHLTPFTERQIEVVQTFADQAVIAISNVRLFEEVQAKTRDLQESLQFQTASADVLKAISRSPDALQPVFDVIVETSRELCRAQASTIFTLREGKFHVAAFAGVQTELLQHMKDHPIALDQKGSALARSVREKRTVHLPNTIDDPEFAEGGPISISGPRATLTVPLMRDGQVIGGITLRQSHLTPFTPRQIEAIESFADQAVIAISNVGLFEQVQERTRELSKSLDDLRTAQDRLIQTEKLASLGQLTAGIAHEIKNPLNFVNNFSALSAELTDELNDVLKQATLAGKIREEVDELTGLLKDNLQKVVQHGKRADSIVKNMLLHSREGSGEHRPADINALVDESLNLAYHGARAEKPQFNVTLQRDFDPNAGLIDLFPQEITRVFLNLISNGFYAVTKRKADNGAGFDPVVSATTRDCGDHVEIRIRDNGVGIPPHVKEKMFNPFFTTKPAGEGTGLGLSMSHDIIVKQHGGTIDVVTEPGQFTEFTVVLPRTSNLSNKTQSSK